jgi:hypothetical protein
MICGITALNRYYGNDIFSIKYIAMLFFVGAIVSYLSIIALKWSNLESFVSVLFRPSTPNRLTRAVEIPLEEINEGAMEGKSIKDISNNIKNSYRRDVLYKEDQ